eukprot:TRINITY_DN776_c0_g2_i1.p1 TRINITY_DN776_c0_g2~~TRINITY_DN776_c0_g2_i1.p1  ORF type:complete len:359 (-),score=188.72 TRINITY_DN776_c0_g2_i1:63-1139(-)
MEEEKKKLFTLESDEEEEVELEEEKEEEKKEEEEEEGEEEKEEEKKEEEEREEGRKEEKEEEKKEEEKEDEVIEETEENEEEKKEVNEKERIDGLLDIMDNKNESTTIPPLENELNDLTKDYSNYFNFPEINKEAISEVTDVAEKLLTFMDENDAIISTIQSDTKKTSEQLIPTLIEQSHQLERIYKLIDMIHHIIKTLGTNVLQLEKRVDDTENKYKSLNSSNSSSLFSFNSSLFSFGKKTPPPKKNMPPWRDFNIVSTEALFEKFRKDAYSDEIWDLSKPPSSSSSKNDDQNNNNNNNNNNENVNENENDKEKSKQENNLISFEVNDDNKEKENNNENEKENDKDTKQPLVILEDE